MFKMYTISHFFSVLFIFIDLLKAAPPLLACDYQMLGTAPFTTGKEGWVLPMRQLCSNNPMALNWTADGSTYSISIIYELDTSSNSTKGRKNATMSNADFYWSIQVDLKLVCDWTTNILKPCIFNTTAGAIIHFVVFGKVPGIQLNPHPIDGTHFNVDIVKPLTLAKQSYTLEQGQVVQAPRKNAPLVMLDSSNQEHYWLTTPNHPMTLTIMETNWDKSNPMPPWAILFGMTEDLNDDSTWSCVGSGSNFIQRCIVQPMPTKQPFALALYPNGFNYGPNYQFTVKNPTEISLQPSQDIVQDINRPYNVQFNQISTINMDSVLLDLYQPDSKIRDIGLRAPYINWFQFKLSIGKSFVLGGSLSYSQFQLKVFRSNQIKPDILAFDTRGYTNTYLKFNDVVSLAFQIPTRKFVVVGSTVRLFVF